MPVDERHEDQPSSSQGLCCCASLPDLAAVPMGGDGLDDRVFATLDIALERGGECWWLYMSICSVCDQRWMIAQEERIYDEYFMRRIERTDAEAMVAGGPWPEEFDTYERVLRVARNLGQHPFTFLDNLAGDLVDTAWDLRKARPNITVEEIAHLIGVKAEHVVRLLKS